MSKYTEGPWEAIGEDGDDFRVRQLTSVKRGAGFSSEVTICEEIRTSANARLIAMSPQLLLALQDAEIILRGIANELPSVKARVDAYADLIAKATGES